MGEDLIFLSIFFGKISQFSGLKGYKSATCVLGSEKHFNDLFLKENLANGVGAEAWVAPFPGSATATPTLIAAVGPSLLLA